MVFSGGGPSIPYSVFGENASKLFPGCASPEYNALARSRRSNPMAKRKDDKNNKNNKHNKHKKKPFQAEEDAKLRAIYDKIRREFTAADLQKYTEIEVGIPAEQVLAEMEKIHRQVTRKKRS
jgi:hypothetical protein